MDSNKTIIRVFPTKTSATPNDDLVRIHTTPSLFDEADEVHISVTFTWDIPWAEWAAKQWGAVAPVKVGGPAYNEPGGEFVPGMYMKKGYVITSRGCPNRCWFCTVPKREGGKLRELPVTDGWIVTDDNLLACSPEHIDEVFVMLAPAAAPPAIHGRAGGCAADPWYGLAPAEPAPRVAVLRLRHAERPRTARRRGEDTARRRIHQSEQQPAVLRADRLPGRYVREGAGPDGRRVAGWIHAFCHALP